MAKEKKIVLDSPIGNYQIEVKAKNLEEAKAKIKKKIVSQIIDNYNAHILSKAK